jgi:general secretion pathway protein L
MKFLRPLADAFSRWIDCVAATIVALFDRFGSRRRVTFVEEKDDTFAVHVRGDGKGSKSADPPVDRIRIANDSLVEALPPAIAASVRGSHAELVLLPSRFLFRPLELPKRAAEYLDGIVRSQIDRLTPWTANEAVYSWTAPVDASNDRIELTIAATARAKIAPYLRAITDLGAASVAVATAAPNAATLRVFEQRARSAINVARIRSILSAVFLLSALAAAVSLGVDAVGSSSMDADQQELQRKIAAIRMAMRGGQDRAGGGTVLQRLAHRKQTKPSSVIVLEALSRALPDHTYVTEFRIDGDKVQVVGVTQDAPSLIELIEKSPNFAHATFFAPTTRTAGEPGERFHIEAHINPVFSFGT